MKIYRIYKWIEDFQWDSDTDGLITVDKKETIKYVDSKEKADDFLNSINDNNKTSEKCWYCPIIRLSKRKYNNGKYEDIINNYCDVKNIYFCGNNVHCENVKSPDFHDYDYEEIDVE